MIAGMIVRRMIRSALDRAFRGDIEPVLAKWSDDGVYEYPANLSAGGTVQGKQAILDWHYKWFEEFPERKIIARNIAFKGWPLNPTNVVMVEWTCEETNKEGKTYVYDGVSVIRTKNGKCVKWTDHIAFKGLPQISTMLKPVGET